MRHPAFERDAAQIERLDADRRGELLTAYLDDELSPEAARYVTAWLDAHPEALREVEHDRRVWDLLELYRDEPVPDAFASQVLDRAGVGAEREGRVLRLRPWVSAAAAVLLMALGAFLFAAVGGPGDGDGTAAPAPELAIETVPADYLEEADLLLALSDEEFEAYLLTDVEVPWEDS